MRRVVVTGNSGSGKSTLAAALGASLGVPVLELDAIYHQAGWTPLPAGEFRARVDAFTGQPGWVVDGNYSAVRDLVWPRADTLVWLDLPRATVMRQLVGRTLRRVVRRTELWNGNRESWRYVVSADPQRSVIRWAWQHQDTYEERFLAAARDPELAHLRFVRVRSRREAAALAASAGR